MAALNRGLIARDKNGKPFGDLRVDAAYGEMWIDDAVGFVSAATPTAEAVKAQAVVKTGRLNNVTHDAALTTERVVSAAGQLEVRRRGDYECYACGDCLSGNAAVVKIELFKNAAVVADAAGFPGGSMRADIKMAGTAVKMPWSFSGVLPDLVFGDLLDLRVTSDVGTVTIKVLRFGIKQISDEDAPVFA